MAKKLAESKTEKPIEKSNRVLVHVNKVDLRLKQGWKIIGKHADKHQGSDSDLVLMEKS